jgi:hypothetical protein
MVNGFELLATIYPNQFSGHLTFVLEKLRNEPVLAAPVKDTCQFVPIGQVAVNAITEHRIPQIF